MTTSAATLIDRVYSEQKELIAFLLHQGQISYSQTVDAFLSKTLLLSSASYFESRIANEISDFASNVSNSNEALVSLIRNKAIERQYHTYFSWREGDRSANPFFAMFGTSLKDSAKKDLKDTELSLAASAFLELGELRNLLVHENFASFPLDKTADEIYSLYTGALRFVSYIEGKLNRQALEPAGTTA